MGLTGQLRLAESIKRLVWATAAALSEQDAAPRGVTQPTEIEVISRMKEELRDIINSHLSTK